MSILNLKNNLQTNNHSFKLYTLFVAIYIIIQIECIMFVNKQIEIFGYNITLSGITFPIDVLLLGVITNSYGYQLARQLLWINNIIIVQFLLYNSVANVFPFANVMVNNQPDVVFAYDILIPRYIRTCITALVSENIAEFIFIWLVSRNKIMHKNGNVGWRIFKYSILANIIMLTIGYMGVFSDYSFTQIIKLIFNVMLIKTLIELLFLYFAIYIANKVRNFEQVDVFDYAKPNPFAFLTQYKYLNIKNINNTEK